MPTIRIDDEVYAWLQARARPFEDSPNSVLRALAGLGMAGDDTATNVRGGNPMNKPLPAKLSGKKLNELWNVGAKHALYHREGSWYNNLEAFPGALFDPNGYVLFQTEEHFRNSRHLKITQETNVPSGISAIPGYTRMRK